MAIDFVALKAELTTDPLGRGYAGFTDQQAADDLNTEYRDVQAVVSADQLRQFLITEIEGTGNNQRSSLDMVREFAEEGTVRGSVPTVTPAASLDARRSACRMIFYMLGFEDPDTNFPVDDTNIRAQFIAIGPDGGNGPTVLTAAQLNTIDGLATRTISRSEELGFGVVGAGDVALARSLP